MADFTRKQLDHVQKLLDDREARLRDEIREELIRSGEEHYIDLATLVADPGDASVADLLSDLDVAVVDRQIQEIRDIEAARERIKAGTFGTCVECGGDIAYERLLAYPTARRCIECQSVHEKTYLQENKPTL
jgi:RNA polymerase-binding protein DksA